MPRPLSDSTLVVYSLLWKMPWACAADIARALPWRASSVSNVLSGGERRGWLVSARLGRVHDAVDRYVFTNAGVKQFAEMLEGPHSWWHTDNGAKALARRLEVVEMAYRYLPDLWQSNALVKPSVYVFRETPDVAWQTGQPVSRVSLVETDWSRAYLDSFFWLQDFPFEAVVVYCNKNSDDADKLYLPILWRGNFQKPTDIASIRRDMSDVLVRDKRWSGLPMAQAVDGPHYPGMVIFCPDRVSAAMVQRNCLENFISREDRAIPTIIDAQGQVVRTTLRQLLCGRT